MEYATRKYFTSFGGPELARVMIDIGGMEFADRVAIGMAVKDLNEKVLEMVLGERMHHHILNPEVMISTKVTDSILSATAQIEFIPVHDSSPTTQKEEEEEEEDAATRSTRGLSGSGREEAGRCSAEGDDDTRRMVREEPDSGEDGAAAGILHTLPLGQAQEPRPGHDQARRDDTESLQVRRVDDDDPGELLCSKHDGSAMQDDGGHHRSLGED
jgi:hypothetical protein